MAARCERRVSSSGNPAEPRCSPDASLAKPCRVVDNDDATVKELMPPDRSPQGVACSLPTTGRDATRQGGGQCSGRCRPIECSRRNPMIHPAPEPLVLVDADGPVLTVTINRPEKRNATNAEVLCRLY